MSNKPVLSREFLYVPIADLSVDITQLTVNRVAFMAAGVEPIETDWIVATVVASAHPLFDPSIGEALAVLVGPDRGDAVTTNDLAAGDYETWIDASVTGSDERIVRVAGTFTVSVTGGV